jgi:hypothetical protein
MTQPPFGEFNLGGFNGVSGDWRQSGVEPPHSKVRCRLVFNCQRAIPPRFAWEGEAPAEPRLLFVRPLTCAARQEPRLLARLATADHAIRSRTLRNGRICQSMAGFLGGVRFCHQMSSEILRIDSVTLTHRSASYEKRPHMWTPISAVDTCGRWLRSTDFQYVMDVRYAISCVSRARRHLGYFLTFQ